MKANYIENILTVYDVKKAVEPLRKMGKSIVTTNGCFDIIHLGHIKYLYEASKLGDILIVGVNSDESVKSLKGEGRPINREGERAFVVASLKMVDYAFVFCEKDPRAFLEVLRPDIHVKGGDYTPEMLPEREVVEKYGGKVVIVPFVKGFSTTSIIKRMSNPNT
ncbi:MAG: D-glycero-beta-D-manno-heptose 1-phosphate adenylyltransferase [Chitinispirillaceae bacterium]|nr:D-glycero-beta-D-manno-heptose 1-phosphate adenylyltransferase [Chitinispirillaceae bacterium]